MLANSRSGFDANSEYGAGAVFSMPENACETALVAGSVNFLATPLDLYR